MEVKEEASRGRESPCPAFKAGGGQTLPVSHVLGMARTQEALLSYVRTSVLCLETSRLVSCPRQARKNCFELKTRIQEHAIQRHEKKK